MTSARVLLAYIAHGSANLLHFLGEFHQRHVLLVHFRGNLCLDRILGYVKHRQCERDTGQGTSP